MKKQQIPATRNNFATQVATWWNVTPDYVRKVIRGERRHAGILKSHRLLQQETRKLLLTIKQQVK
jgi:hypothetical protein